MPDEDDVSEEPRPVIEIDFPAEFRTAPSRNAPTGPGGAYLRATTLAARPGWTLEAIGSAIAIVLRRPILWMANGAPAALIFGAFVYSQLSIATAIGSAVLLQTRSKLPVVEMYRLGVTAGFWMLFLLYFALSAPGALRVVRRQTVSLRNVLSFGGRIFDFLAFAILGGAALTFAHFSCTFIVPLVMPVIAFVPFVLADTDSSFFEACGKAARLGVASYGLGILVWLILFAGAALSFGLAGIGFALFAPVLAITTGFAYETFGPTTENASSQAEEGVN